MADDGPLEESLERAIKKVRGTELQKSLREQAALSSDTASQLQTMEVAQAIRNRQGSSWILMFALAALSIALLLFFMSRLEDGSALTNVASGRPILMLIVIFTTVIFGAMLLNATLFGPQVERAAERFQNGREIFLVFSGICATVVGFYFGSGTVQGNMGSNLVISQYLAPGDGSLALTIAGGSPPYGVVLHQDDAAIAFTNVESDPGRFTLATDSSVCPAGAEIRITGANGTVYSHQAVAFTEGELQSAGWSACPLPDEGAVNEPDGAAT